MFTGQPFGLVVIVCNNARDTYPIFLVAAERLHWSFDDPAAVEGTEAERLVEFRRIRDQIHRRVKEFLQWAPSPGA